MKKRKSVKKRATPKQDKAAAKTSSKKTKKEEFDPAYRKAGDAEEPAELDVFGEKMELEDSEPFSMEIEDDKDA